VAALSPADTRAIMRALKATTPAPASGGYGQIPGPSIGAGPSPLVASYSEWTSGRAQGTSAALPRDWATYLSGTFGPLAPIRPVPIDTPQPGEDRPEPRRLQYPVGWNMPMGMPGSEGLGKLADFHTLRTLADLYSVARACIELRKSELRGVGWDIGLTKDAAKDLRNDRKGMASFAKRRAAAVKFFRRPDPYYSDFTAWFDALLEEVLVTDALALYVHPARGKGKGLLGSSIAALDLIDGSLIRPLMDVRGGKPAAPSPAYQQFEHGVPRVDLMTLLLGADDPEQEKLTAEYRGDQLMYLPYSQRTWTPYGQAPIERAIIPIMTGLNKQQFQLNFFQEGSIPGLFISPGDPNMTPSQIRELQDALNSLAGDQSWKHKIIVLPGGSHVDPQKPNALADAFDEIVMVQVCMAFNVMPMELGISPRVSATQSTGAAHQMAKACYTSDVEVLTRRGWLPFSSVKVGDAGDEFATRNPKTFAFEWQHATAYHEYDHDGELVEFTSTHGRQAKDEGLHLRVTPNHRMVTVEPIAKSSPVAYKEYIREAGDIRAQRISVPLTSAWEGSGPQSVRFGKHEWAAADFAALLGAYIAEGHLRRQRGYYKRAGEWVRRGEDHINKQICISQQRTSKGYEAYHELLTRMLGREPGYNHGTFYFACAELWDYLDVLGHASEKHIPAAVKDWSAPALQALLDHYLLGDGYLENGAWRAKTVSERLAGDLQEVAQKLGMSATLTLMRPRDVFIKGRLIAAENCQDCYLVRFNKSLTRRMTITRTHYTGKVYCVTTPNGIIYVRENGSPVWCGNSQDIQERKGTVPLLLWLKNAIFDTILQDVCGNDDLEWKWEGLEEDEDAKTLTELLVQQIGTGLRSIDEARAELGLDPWGLPVTSDPGWASQMSGFVPFTAAPVEQIAALAAGQLPPGQEPAGQQLGQRTPPQPAGQKPQSALQAPAKPSPAALPAGKPGGSAGTPAHSGASASAASPPAARGAGKAALRELDLLRGHLRKGGTADMWWPRDLPGHILAGIAEDMGKGLTADQVIAGARVLLSGKSDGRLAGKVHAYLARHYPESVLGWVDDADWHGPATVPLADVDMARRPGGRDEAKVRAIAAAVQDGKQLEPVVLVSTPGDSQYQIADGYHRTLGLKHAGKTTVQAWIGDVDADHGPWDTAMHAAKLNKTAAEGDAGPKGRHNPGWEHDQALAAAAARQLASELRDAISSRALARNWLARSTMVMKIGHHTAGSYLGDTALAAAIQAILTRILRKLWQDAWRLGRRSAAQILGTAEVAADEAELARLLTQASGRIPGMVQTRISQIESILNSAAPDTTAEALEVALEDAISGETAALAVAETETTWSMAEGMLGYYYGAGVTTVGWSSAGDERVCSRCEANQADGYIAVGTPFYSGDTQPPGHVRCRCALIAGDILGSPLPLVTPLAA
jgi:Phage portal protein/ParB-like nuclease domain